MTGRPKSPIPDRPTPDRQAKLAAALRDNLKKRKAQAHARAETDAATRAPDPGGATKKPNPKP